MSLQALTESCLVLNKSWLPITILSAKSAIVASCTFRAYLVDIEDWNTYTIEEWMERDVDLSKSHIVTSRGAIQTPEIIVLSQFNSVPTRTLVYSRKHVWTRDEYTCQYCTIKLKRSEATIDHVIPKSQGGKTSFDNCVTSCGRCNKKKDARIPTQAGMPLKKVVNDNGQKQVVIYEKPRKPHWSAVFNMKNGSDAKESWKKFL